MAGVRVRGQERRRDALVVEPRALDGAIGGERVAPDRQVRLAVHRRGGGDLEDLPAIGGLVAQAGEVAAAPRDDVLGVEGEHPRPRRRTGAEVAEHAVERDREPARRRGRLDEGDRSRRVGLPLDQRALEERHRGEELVASERGQGGDPGQAARGEPLLEDVPELEREPAAPVRRRPRLDRPDGAPGVEPSGRVAERVERHLEPEDLRAAIDAVLPVDDVLRVGVTRVEEAAVVGEQAMVVDVGDRDDGVPDEVIEHQARDELGGQGDARLDGGGDDQARRQEAHPVRERLRHPGDGGYSPPHAPDSCAYAHGSSRRAVFFAPAPRREPCDTLDPREAIFFRDAI